MREHFFSKGCNQPVYVFGACGPAGADADGCVTVVHPLPEGEEEVLAQPFQQFIRKNGKLLVRVALHEEAIALFTYGVADAKGLGDGVAGDVEIKIVVKKRGKLDAEQASFGQKSAMLLDAVTEVVL